MKIRAGFVSNSSSEAFICRTEHSVKETREILQKILDYHNDIFSANYKFENVFKDPKLITKEDTDIFKDFGYNIHPEDYTKIVIYSVTDNTIPYELFDMIDSKFNAYRIHLG